MYYNIMECCSGILSRPMLEEFLTGPPFEIEVHDTERQLSAIKPIPKIYNHNEPQLYDTSGNICSVHYNLYILVIYDIHQTIHLFHILYTVHCTVYNVYYRM